MDVKKWLSKNTHSLKGKNVAITGATGGIGKELCAYLGLLGANLILMDRNMSRSRELGDSIAIKYGINVSKYEIHHHTQANFIKIYFTDTVYYRFWDFSIVLPK